MGRRPAGQEDSTSDLGHRPDPQHRRVGEAVCDLCGGPVLERHCKVVCRNCGFQRDCSDP